MSRRVTMNLRVSRRYRGTRNDLRRTIPKYMARMWRGFGFDLELNKG